MNTTALNLNIELDVARDLKLRGKIPPIQAGIVQKSTKKHYSISIFHYCRRSWSTFERATFNTRQRREYRTRKQCFQRLSCIEQCRSIRCGCERYCQWQCHNVVFVVDWRLYFSYGGIKVISFFFCFYWCHYYLCVCLTIDRYRIRATFNGFVDPTQSTPAPTPVPSSNRPFSPDSKPGGLSSLVK